jgi:Holliday junction resolvase RusA-like endonuclease
MTTFTVYGEPATKGSTVSFIGKKGIVTKHDCATLAGWTKAVAWAAKSARVQLAGADEPICISVLFQFVRPASAKTRRAPTRKPDIDKLLRALLDALTGVAYVDDSRVVEIYARKTFGLEELMTVTIRQEA